MTTPWRIEMLGGLAIVHGDRRINRFQTQKTGALLAYLALNPGKNHGRESLAEMLWPEGDPLAIRNRLNQAISSLRRQLHPPELGPGSVLVTDHHSIGINAQTVLTDVEDFERLVRQAERAEDDLERIRLLESAVDMYKGELLEGYYEEWVFSRRMHLADLHDKSLQQLIRSYVAIGKPDGAIEFARRRLQTDPYDEAPHVILMRLYLRSGRPKSALKQYEDLVRALQHFDEEPSENALKYKLKAESLAEDQSAGEDFDDDFDGRSARRVTEPIVPTREDLPSNLPRVVSSFVGRDEELELIYDQFKTGKTRLVTILGLGGCGKTRLAIEAGWGLVETCQARVYFVSLASVVESEGLIGELERVLLPGQASAADPRESVVARLNALGKCLLILDNFEHLAEGGAPQVAELLASAPGLCVLATSRVPLSIDGELQIALAPLPLPDESFDDLRELASNPAIALFVDRAQVVKSDFQLTERTAGAIVELSRILEGLPLALELAASWARVLTVSQMVEQVQQNVDRLESRRRDINPRHRSLRAAFDGSFDLLEDEMRAVFLRMTLFSGGWDLAAAEFLCPGMDVVAAMQALEERSMIQSEPTDDEVRFAMLETIRSFGCSLLEPMARAELEDRHAEYFHALAQQGTGTWEWVPQVERNYPNCVAALHRLRERGKIGELAQMAIALSRFWDARGMQAEGREWLDWLLEEGQVDDPLTRARIKAAIGRLEWVVGNFQSATGHIQDALEVFVEAGAVQDQILAQFVLQHEAHRKGDYAEARRLLDSNLKISQSIGDLASESRCWLALGNATIEEGDFDTAHRNYEQSLEVGRRSGDREAIGAALTNLANLAAYRGNLEAAETWISESFKNFDKSSWKWYYSMSLVVRGRIENELGEFRRAARSLTEAYRTAPNESLVVWRFVMLFSLTLFGLGLPKDGARLAGFLDRYRERIGERHRGVEIRHFEERLATLKSALSDAEFAEQSEIGSNMSLDDLDAMIKKVHRLFLSEV